MFEQSGLSCLPGAYDGDDFRSGKVWLDFAFQVALDVYYNPA